MSAKNYACTASLLENYRAWRDGDMFLNEADEQLPDVVVWVKRLDAPATPQMAVGTAFHKMIEKAKAGDNIEIVDSMGYTFDLRQLDAALAFPSIVENRYFRLFHATRVSGQVDAITKDGCIVDYKTCTQIDPEKYIRSFQWRTYLWLTGLNRFRFDVFRIMPPTEKEPNVYRVVEHLPITCHRYDGMDREVELLIHSFNEAMDSCSPMREAVHRAAIRRAKEAL